MCSGREWTVSGLSSSSVFFMLRQMSVCAAYEQRFRARGRSSEPSLIQGAAAPFIGGKMTLSHHNRCSTHDENKLFPIMTTILFYQHTKTVI
jgi:hypothetical protein